jgi:hypothetical protein
MKQATVRFILIDRDAAVKGYRADNSDASRMEPT